jgi:hypothetical protein
MATPAASSEAELMRLPEDRRAIDVSMSRLTLEAEAAALRAALLVAIASAILEFLILACSLLHSGDGLRFKIDGRCTLHSAEALGAWSARFAQRIDLCLCVRQTSLDPCRKLSLCKVVSRSCKPAHIVTITEAIEVISDSCKPIDAAVITEAITVISKSCKPAGIVAET